VGLKERIKDRIERLRERRPSVDHTVRMVQHYGAVNGSLQAGAVTFFAFLSFFPILAFAFAVIGYLANIYPEAKEDLVQAISDVLPGIVSVEDTGRTISIDTLQAAAPGILTVGLLVMLYSGLGWISAMRQALHVVFEKPAEEQPGFAAAKLRDLIALVVLGVILILSVGVSGVVTSLAEPVLDFLDLDAGVEPALWVIALALGLAANSLLFFAFFKLLANPTLPNRSLWSGALLGAVGFEALKQLSRWLIAAISAQPGFQVFGIALILLIWINYFARVVVYAAAWAHTTREARELREREAVELARMNELARVDLHEATPPRGSRGKAAKTAGKSFAAGGATALAVAAVLRRKKEQS
jgi:membrane protein